MKIKSIKSLWGMEGSLESQFEQIAAAGFHGIESPVPSQLAITGGVNVEEKRFRSLLEQYKLDYVSMVFTEGPDHAESFRRQTEQAAALAPIMINSHSAKDAMPFDEQAAFFSKKRSPSSRDWAFRSDTKHTGDEPCLRLGRQRLSSGNSRN